MRDNLGHFEVATGAARFEQHRHLHLAAGNARASNRNSRSSTADKTSVWSFNSAGHSPTEW